MSKSTQEYYEKFGKRWAMLTREQAYKDAIETLEATSDCLRILDKSPAEIKGVGEILIAKQQGYLEALNDLNSLAQVPEEYISGDLGQETYPDPLDEVEEPVVRKRK